MWYILNDLEKIIENLSANYKGKYLIINQTFYKGEQRYGTEFFTSQKELIEYLPWKCLSKGCFDIMKDIIETHQLFIIE